MKEKDEKLVKKFNEIYNKHREAFKLIYENVNIDKAAESEIVCDILREYANDNKIIYDDDNSWRFFTTKMDDYLPKLPNDNSSWGTNWVYYYWLEKWDSMIIIHLEIGGWNVPTETELKMETLIDVSKQLGNKVNPVKPFRYKRLYRKNLTINADDYEESLKKQVKKLIEEGQPKGSIKKVKVVNKSQILKSKIINKNNIDDYLEDIKKELLNLLNDNDEINII